MSENKNPKVLVLLSSYNGEKYIEQQIDSVIAQKNVDVNLIVRDDGSSDGTINILEKYKKQGKLDWYAGDNIRPAKSFVDLIYHVQSDYEYYAFCDQDDFWEPEKLCSGISKLKPNENVPSLYYCNLDIVNSELNHIRYTLNDKKKDYLEQTLLVFSVPGCAMIFNKKLLEVIRTFEPDKEKITMHDCWIYYICLAARGVIVSDDKSYIKYRQHDSNAIGASKISIIEKFKMIACNPYHKRADMIREILTKFDGVMDENVKESFTKFANYPNSIRCKLHFISLSSFGVFNNTEFTKAKLRVLFNTL